MQGSHFCASPYLIDKIKVRRLVASLEEDGQVQAMTPYRHNIDEGSPRASIAVASGPSDDLKHREQWTRERLDSDYLLPCPVPPPYRQKTLTIPRTERHRLPYAQASERDAHTMFEAMSYDRRPRPRRSESSKLYHTLSSDQGRWALGQNCALDPQGASHSVCGLMSTALAPCLTCYDRLPRHSSLLRTKD